MKKIMFFSLILLLPITGITGCASILDDPYFQDAITYPDSFDLEDAEQKVRLSFIAREMMESDDRSDLLSDVTDSPRYRSWSESQTAVAAQMTTDIAVGQAVSSAGLMVGSTMHAAGLILSEINDGSMDEIGQAFLPDTFYGEKLDTPEKAQKALIRYTRTKVQTMADELGWQYDCIYGCDSWNQIFTLTRNGQGLDERFIYKPETIVIKSIIMEPEKVDSSDPISAMTGFPVAWKTAQGHTYVVHFYAEPSYENSGQIRLFRSEQDGHMYPDVKRNLVETKLGRGLRRMFHSSAMTMYGNQDVYPKQFYFDGVIYSFISNSDTRMIDLVLQEDALLQ